MLEGWNLAYDFAALVVMAILFVWYGNEKRIPSRAHKTFLALCISLTSVISIEIVEVFAVRYREHVSNTYMSIILYVQMMLLLGTSLCFALYFKLITRSTEKQLNVFSVIAKIASIILVLLIIINEITGCMFVFDGTHLDMNYALILPYGLDIIIIGTAFTRILKLSKEISFRKCLVLGISVILCAIAGVLQIIEVATIFCFTLSVGCMTMYHYLQNPLSVMDTTTGLFNRRFMNDYISRRFETGKGMGVIFVAMDDFKFINKSYGIDTGDNLLLQVGDFLNNLKNNGVVFRFGSDQFCLVIDKHLSRLADVAEEIHERFMHPWFSISSEPIMMSASICIVKCPQEADSCGELVEILDYSMALAKKTKKGGVCFASDLNLDKVRRDKAIEKAVKLAMDRDEIMVYYQPIYSVEKNAYNSAEALVRLKDEELGWIPPDEFIPISEKNGLIVELGDMILDKVCRFIRDFNLADSSIEYIEVNISTLQLMNSDFASRVKNILNKYDVKPNQINIEITETATMGELAVVSDNIGELVEYGINFSLDDYGSGYSNIDYINQMPFSIIKLDKSIIWEAFKNDKAGITLKYTIGMLNALKLLIVAEGVETEDMKNHLVEIGCHYMQGWYYSKAVCDKEFITLIEKNA